MISSQGGAFEEGASILAEVKTISGRRIEERRKRHRITQKQLAADVGIGVRWLREIEAGNPKSRVDDHIACAHALGLSSAHLIIPMLFLEHNMHFPRHFFLDDMHQLEALCIDFISNLSLRTFLQPADSKKGPSPAPSAA
ncbi:helix-turn-helix domain-containing protein [Sphingobium yanoikuyae]|uniref:Helix-turn-helix domain-containing protein n=1 Tax=Sphingobium yanoikuyae TaxID=13690 RepID=A0A9X7YFU0_SPHYA|nr:helix-turn-helix domain-containing protein [Sphingobium yanoikuyae]QNG48548.1 helix-turn-helix domain-containing protein [Sphingobium yanoikuyae]